MDSASQLSRFWKELINAKQTGNRIDLIIPFPNKKKDSQSIFVRSCYPLLMDIFKEKDEDVFLSGTPGIGKTHFLLYLLWNLRQRKNVKIILHRDPIDPVLLSVGENTEGMYLGVFVILYISDSSVSFNLPTSFSLANSP